MEEFLHVMVNYVGLYWKDHIENDENDENDLCYFRHTNTINLVGNTTKAKEVLRWKLKVGFEDLVKIMIDHDHVLAAKEKEHMRVG